MKKLLSVFLALITLLSVFSIAVSAEAVISQYDAKVGDVYYSIFGNEAYVTGYELDSETKSQGKVVVPETVRYRGNDYTVVAVNDNAFYKSTFSSITLPSTVSYIGDYAFSTCDFLEEVVIPENCYFDYFGEGVFDASAYEAVVFSQECTIFGQNVLFAYTGNADKYVIPEEIDIIVPKAFFMSGVKSVVINENITEIPYMTFALCRNLTSINIPDNVEIIGEAAFKDCTSLKTVTLGEGVTTLGVDCFANTSIKSLHLGQAVYSVFGAFRNCKTLEKITVDPGNTSLRTDGKAVYFKSRFVLGDIVSGYILVHYIPSKAQGKIKLIDDVLMVGAYAFYDCDNLEEVTSDTLLAVDTGAFSNSSIKKLSADNVTAIWDGAFKNCDQLTDIDLSSVEYIETAAFENCTSLTKVEFSENITDIGSLAFSNTGITELSIKGDECEIHESAFKGCQNLESVRIEEGVKSVGMNAFLDCPELRTIYISKTVKEIDKLAFNGCDNVTFELVRSTEGYKHIARYTDFNYEIVGRYTLFQRIIDFFRSLFS